MGDLDFKTLNTRLRIRDENATKQYIEAKKRRVEELKEEILFKERRLRVSRDMLSIAEKELDRELERIRK